MIRAISLFCGLGGFDMGLYRAAEALGIEVEVVGDYDSMPCAVKCYNANLPHPVAKVADVKQMQRSDLPPHDLIFGGPPCQDHSSAGKRKCRCNKGGDPTARCCLRDFVRLAGDTPYVMENVVSRLINAPWSEKLCAADFGDVTSRKRWFYSNYLLHVVPTPGPRRIRDIRDHAEDARVLAKRSGCLGVGRGVHSHYLGSEVVQSLTAHAWHGLDTRSGKTLGIAEDDDVLGSLTSTSAHGPKRNGNGEPTANHLLRLGLRGNSASAFEDDEILGSVLSNSFHANEASKLVGCRNPSLLEMARAHSIPDAFDWCGATKTRKGQMIANSVPVGMATAVMRAILLALAREKGIAA